MRKAVIAILAVALIACVLSVPTGDADAADTPSTSTTTPTIPEGATVVASGNCGTGNGAASWSYVRSSSTNSLSISDGNVVVRSSSWSGWTLSTLEITKSDGTKETISDIQAYTPNILFTGNPDLILSGSVTADSTAMRSIDPRTLTTGSGFTSVPASMFLNCSDLKTVTLSDSVKSIGAKAFEGCTALSSFDVKKATVDQTAFKGCTNLKTFSATGSSTYDVTSGMLYTLGGDTMYLCPTGKTGTITLSDLHTNAKTVNLGYADVFYALDMLGSDRTITFANGVDSKDIKSRGLIYSTLGMKTSSVVETGTNQGDFTISYTLYNGWAVVQEDGTYSGATASLSNGMIRLTLEEGKYAATAYPMGVRTLTYENIAELNVVDGWSVTLDSVPTKTGVVQDIDAIKITVKGYVGSDSDATLSGTVRFHGIGFEVTSVSLTASTAGNLQNLTIGDGIPVGKDSFTGLSGLKSVKADYVSEVGEGAFRFCTALKEASFTACSSFGAYAFESCWSLETLDLGPNSITFGDDALRGCKALRLLTVGMDAKIEGAGDVVVLHHDMTDTSDKTFEVHGDFVLITWWYGRTIQYSETNDQATAESMEFYYGSPNPTTVIPVSDEMYVWVSTGPLNTSGRILVVFDYGLGVGYDTQKILTGTTASDPGSRIHLGYHFQYWTLDGTNPFDFSTELIQSTVLTAVWSKEDPVDTTPIYLGVILAASVIATFAVLAIGRRKH